MKNIYIVVSWYYDCEGKYLSESDRDYFSTKAAAVKFIKNALKDCRDVNHPNANRWTHFWGRFVLEKVKLTA